MGKTIIALCTLALASFCLFGEAKAQYQYQAPYVITQPGSDEPPSYANPMPGGGYEIIQPGAPDQPPTYIQPIPSYDAEGPSGYVVTQPGASPYQPPTYIAPMPSYDDGN